MPEKADTCCSALDVAVKIATTESLILSGTVPYNNGLDGRSLMGFETQISINGALEREVRALFLKPWKGCA